jgi:predicted SprT family Zn-dependent metalloprotease
MAALEIQADTVGLVYTTSESVDADPGKPTGEMGALMQQAFDYFNERLFGSDLAQPMIVLKASRRKTAFGHHKAKAWVDGLTGKPIAEIALNPEMFVLYGPQEAAQTLVHEMCHLWQYQHGSPSRVGYHNTEWADKMQEVGLMPSNTGKLGGKVTGQAMSDYPIEGGVFLEALAEFTDWKLRWSAVNSADGLLAAIVKFGTEETAFPIPSKGASNPTKKKVGYRCPKCGNKAWGKPELNLICGDCHEDMVSK